MTGDKKTLVYVSLLSKVVWEMVNALMLLAASEMRMF